MTRRRARRPVSTAAGNAGKSALEEQLARDLRLCGFPEPERELKFHPGRRWRFDFAWPDRNLAVEVEGGIWSNGRHTRGAGFEADCEKYNTALVNGWRVIRVTAKMISSGQALAFVEAALETAEEV